MNIFEQMAEGRLTTEEMKTILPTIEITRDNLVMAAEVYRDRMIKIEAPEGTIDVCGTGGSGRNNLNVSTAVAFVVAACGVPVAKHGNRAASSRCGSSDVLEALEIDINLSPKDAERCLKENGLVFLHAPNYHPAFKYVAQARKELGVKTIFNYLGPLLNPAQVKKQLIGCSNYQEEIIGALKRLGNEECFLIKEEIEGIEGGDARHNAGQLIGLLTGEKSVYRDIVVHQAGIAINHKTPFSSTARARRVIDCGQTLELYEKIKNFK